MSVFESLKVMIIEVGGEFTETAPLDLRQWLITMALGAIAIPLGVLMRFIPVKVSCACHNFLLYFA